MADTSTVVALFGKGFYSKSKTATAQLLTNMYREPETDLDKSPMTLYGTPGLTRFIVPAAPIRARRVVGNYLWYVADPYVYTVSNLGVVVQSGVLGMVTSAGRVSMSDNGTQVIFVDGVKGYTVTCDASGASTGNVTAIASVNFPNGATTVTFLNGFFICDNPNGSRVGQFNWSSQYDGTTWSSLDFANAESSPDPLVHVFANFGQLFLFGTLTTEVWAPTGGQDVFARVGAAAIEWGLASKWSLDKFSNTSLVFLGKNKLGQAQVVKMDGYNIVPLVEPDVTNAINLQDVTAASGYAYSIDAHSFYQLNLPNNTYLYDDLSNSWSVVTSGTIGGRNFGEIRVEFNAIPYVADYMQALLYKVSPATYLDDATTIIREVITKHVFSSGNMMSIDEVWFEFEPGVGLNSGQGINPQAMLSWSKDGGFTYGNEISTTIGAVGAYRARATWRNLGRARDIVFKLRVSDPVKVVMTNAAMRVS